MSYTGIGAATVRRLIKEGASVVIADISADAGTALAAELGSHAAFVSCDVRHAHAPICRVLSVLIIKQAQAEIRHGQSLKKLINT